MKLITLISDWTTHEPYVAMFKGRIYAQLQDVNVVDITHTIEIANVNQTAFILRNSFSSFPEGTVHLVLTNASRYLLSSPVVICLDGHFFIGDDDGIFALLSYEKQNVVSRIFSAGTGDYLQKMIQLAGYCINGNWQEHTEEYVFKKRIPFVAEYIESQNMISGHIAYIDSYSNVLTNIPVSLFEEKVHNGIFTARVDSLSITHLHSTYEQDTEPYLVPNCLGVMEIAAYRGRVSILAKWQKDTSVDIYCYRLNS